MGRGPGRVMREVLTLAEQSGSCWLTIEDVLAEPTASQRESIRRALWSLVERDLIQAAGGSQQGWRRAGENVHPVYNYCLSFRLRPSPSEYWCHDCDAVSSEWWCPECEQRRESYMRASLALLRQA